MEAFLSILLRPLNCNFVYIPFFILFFFDVLLQKNIKTLTCCFEYNEAKWLLKASFVRLMYSKIYFLFLFVSFCEKDSYFYLVLVKKQKLTNR